MARIVEGGLMQASNPIPGDDDLVAIEQAMIDKHLSRDDDELITAHLDMAMIRDPWQFFGDRRPDSYDDLVAP